MSVSLSCYLLLLVSVSLFHSCLSSNKNAVDDVLLLCKDDERQALLEFKYALVDEADRLASWVDDAEGNMNTSDCCKWGGIVCDNITGHVHHIHLPGMDGHCHDSYNTDKEYEEALKQRLRGNLSPSLLRLKQLRHLDLSCNDFGGIEVPKFIASLGNLRYLNLSNSDFGGNIPPQLGNLTELHVLCLGATYYEPTTSMSMMSMQWLSGLRFLNHLDLSGVNLTKAVDWLHVINTLPSLVQLHLSQCQLSNIDPHVPNHNLTSLSLLDLSHNNFYNSAFPVWIFSITSLVSLDLSGCSIPSSINSFRNLTSLEQLHVSGNDFMNSSIVLEELSSIGSNLISLDISYCGVSSSVLDTLHNLTSLQSLDLSHNQLTKTIPKSLGNLCNLIHLDLSANDFSNISLEHLLESFFNQLLNLESLDLSDNQLHGSIPESLGQLLKLESLHLSYNRLNGSLPENIGQLLKLEALDLSDNQLHGSIPESLGQLLKLGYLDLSHNRLNGSLPESLGQLLKLEYLDLSHNRLNGSLPESLGQLLKLKILHLSDNQLHGSIPESLGQLLKLENLYLSENQLNGSLPESLGQLLKLEYLDFSNNLMSGVVTEAHFAKLACLIYLIGGGGNNLILKLKDANWIPPFKLQLLNLNSWGLGPQLPLWLQLQSDLQKLDISNTSISSPMPRESFWISFPNLEYLDMSHNHIQGTLSFIGMPATLQVLDLNSNEFRGNLPNLSNNPDLYVLDLSSNFFVGSTHYLLCPNYSTSLGFVNLGNNHLSGVIPECWEKWHKLRILNLENNNLTGGIPTTLGYSSELELLNMHGNKLTGRLPSSLKNLTELGILQLGGNELVGNIPAWFGTTFSFLRILNLRSNNFSGDIPQELCYLTRIQILDLAHNNLSETIPRCFNKFSVLSGKEEVSRNEIDILRYGSKWVMGSDEIDFLGHGSKWVMGSDSLVMKGREDTYNSILGLVRLLDLSSNNLVGDIPHELMDLVKLNTLNLSINQLTGRIPDKVGNMKAIETLDLSVNKLSGELPASLSSLTSLLSFNVSYNNLSGKIPTSTQLQSFNGSCFFGNKLYGAPLTNSSVQVEVPDSHQEEDDVDDWGFIISMVYGSIVGFWIIVAPLIVSTSWRIAYFCFFTELGYMVYDAMHKYCFKMFCK